MTSSLFLKSHACWPLAGPPGYSAGVMGGRLLREGGQRPHCSESVGGAAWGRLSSGASPVQRGPALPQQEHRALISGLHPSRPVATCPSQLLPWAGCSGTRVPLSPTCPWAYAVVLAGCVSEIQGGLCPAGHAAVSRGTAARSAC